MLRCLQLILILIFTGFNSVFAQDFSNKGKEFYITFPSHANAALAVMGLYITADEDVNVKVYAGNNVTEFRLDARGVRRVFIGPNGDMSNAAVYLNQEEGIKAGSAVRVIADKPVVVYSHIIRTARSAATLVLPTNVWGRKYITPLIASTSGSDRPQDNEGYPVITVVAKEANTSVEIVTKTATTSGKPAGFVLAFTLQNPGDVYQVKFARNSDISGTEVNSVSVNGEPCRPIAVFASSTWSAFGCASPSGGDNLYQQLFPVGTWGRNYITAPFKGKDSDIVRVYISEPNTTVTKLENGNTTQLLGLVNNSFYEYRTNNPTKITSDKPVSVVHFIMSQTCNTNNMPSDPEMIILNPVEQTINNISVFSAHRNYVPPNQSNIDKCFLNIVIKSNSVSSFRINDRVPSGTFVPITGTEFSYLQEDVTAITLESPVQQLKADSSFMAIAYGFGNVESYGYNAGTNVRDLNQFVTIKNDDIPVDGTTTCINTNFGIYFTLPYIPVSLTWDFKGLFSNETINNPVPDSSYIKDGIRLYRFPLSSSHRISQLATYPVSIIIKTNGSDGCGGETSFDFDLTTIPQPTADFNFVSSNCIGEAIQFKSVATAPESAVTKYSWNFGDGNTAEDKDVENRFTATGRYNVAHTVSNNVGCIVTATKALNFSHKPVASYSSIAPYCENTLINISNNSTINNASKLDRMYWSFGDDRVDTISANASVSVSYTTVGSYQLSLKAVSETGCISEPFVQTITIGRGPRVAVNYTNACEKQPVVLTANVTDNGGANITNYNWNVNNVAVAQNTASITTNGFTSVTSFPARLQVTNANGCTSESVGVNVPLGQLPVAGFTLPGTICLPLGEAVFVNTSTISDGTESELKYTWSSNFSNQQSLLKNGILNFGTIGNYNVKLLVESNKGCKDSVIQIVSGFTPQPRVTMRVSDNEICLGEIISVSGSANVNSQVISSWSIDYKDGGRINANTDNHLYTQAGTYPVSMYYALQNGCYSDTAITTVLVNPNPVIGVKEPVNVTMGNSLQIPVTITGTTTNTFVWSPGLYLDRTDIASPITSTQEDITYRLTVSSDKGCVSSKDIFVKYIPMPVFSNAFSPNGDGVNDTWQIRNLAEYSNASIEVFDRYGTIVFKSIGYNIPWDGSRNGKPMPVGTYYYVVNLRDGSSVFKGAITLLR